MVRYRLMDVDVIFQQGYVYTLATVAVLGVFYALIFSLGKFEDLSPTAAGVLILIAAFVFQPIRNWIQEQLDRYVFYKDRYDYRRTLIEFARELGSETDLDAMLRSVADRLLRTLSVRQGGVLPERRRGAVPSPHDARRRIARPGRDDLDLSFLAIRNPTSRTCSSSSTRAPAGRASRGTGRRRCGRPIADLDLTYYLALRGARPHHRLPGREPHRQGRLPVQRRY